MSKKSPAPSGSIEAYWRGIQHFQPLSHQRESEMIAKAREGDDRAMHQMVEANLRFDETRGFKFVTDAVWWIGQAILKALAEQSKIARPTDEPGRRSAKGRKTARCPRAEARALS